jgi:hypothetical protein
MTVSSPGETSRRLLFFAFGRVVRRIFKTLMISLLLSVTSNLPSCSERSRHFQIRDVVEKLKRLGSAPDQIPERQGKETEILAFHLMYFGSVFRVLFDTNGAAFCPN